MLVVLEKIRGRAHGTVEIVSGDAVGNVDNVQAAPFLDFYRRTVSTHASRPPSRAGGNRRLRCNTGRLDQERTYQVFEFVCDRIIPGCTHEDRDKSKEQLLERAAAHLREHHNLDHHQDPIGEVLERTGIIFIRPA